MIVSGNFDQALPHRVPVTIRSGEVFGRIDIVGGRGIAEGPHAYLVEQTGGVTLNPHFHMNDQFQVVLHGSGMLGRLHALKPVTVHYARGRTAYGPIVADAGGLGYLTLRTRTEYGASYLNDPKTVPDRNTPKFQATSGELAISNRQQLAALGANECSTVLAEGEDGLGAWWSRLPAGTVPDLPSRYPHAGRFHVVVGGTVTVGAETLPPWSCVWSSPDQPLDAIAAGPHGAELLSVQFPCVDYAAQAAQRSAAGARATGE